MNDLCNLAKCEKCGCPMFISNSPDCSWRYIEGYWVHDCSKQETWEKLISKIYPN